MRDEFVLDSRVQGGGLQLALIDRFLRDTQRGTAEQFATAFVLLARSLGIEARVATGFVAPESAEATQATRPGDVLELSSADAAVWPEVQLGDGRWLASTRCRWRRRPTVPRHHLNHRCSRPPPPSHRSRHRPTLTPTTPPPEETASEQTSSTLSTVITWAARRDAGRRRAAPSVRGRQRR